MQPPTFQALRHLTHKRTPNGIETPTADTRTLVIIVSFVLRMIDPDRALGLPLRAWSADAPRNQVSSLVAVRLPTRAFAVSTQDASRTRRCETFKETS